MQLFAGPSEEFIADATQQRIAARLGDSFYDYYRFRASASEFTAWRNSLSALANQLRYSGVRDHGVVLEMQLPLSSARLDAFVFGHSPAERESSVLVELKQWTAATPSDFDGASGPPRRRPGRARTRDRAAQRRGRRRADDGRLLLAVVRSERGRDAHRRCDDRRLPATSGGRGMRNPMRASSRRAFRRRNFGRPIPAASIRLAASTRRRVSSSRRRASFGAPISSFAMACGRPAVGVARPRRENAQRGALHRCREECISRAADARHAGLDDLHSRCRNTSVRLRAN